MKSLRLLELCDSEFLGDGLHSSIGDLMVVDEPVEAFSGGCNVIGHDLAETFIIGNYEEIYHDDVAQLQPVEQVGHAHFAESVEDDDGGARVGIDEVLDLLQEDLGVFYLGHWEED